MAYPTEPLVKVGAGLFQFTDCEPIVVGGVVATGSIRVGIRLLPLPGEALGLEEGPPVVTVTGSVGKELLLSSEVGFSVGTVDCGKVGAFPPPFSIGSSEEVGRKVAKDVLQVVGTVVVLSFDEV